MYSQIWWHSLQLQHLRRWGKRTVSKSSPQLLGETLFKHTEGRKGRKKHSLTEWWSITSYEVGQETYTHFLKTSIKRFNRHVKRWLTSLVIAEIQIKKVQDTLPISFFSLLWNWCGLASNAVSLAGICFSVAIIIGVRVRLPCGKMLF